MRIVEALVAHGEAEVAADEKGWLWLLEEESCGRKGEAMPMRIWVGGGGWAIVFHDGAEVVVAVNTTKREGRATMAGEKPGGGWFFPNFGLWFLHLQCLESTPIYRGWKMDIVYIGDKS